MLVHDEIPWSNPKATSDEEVPLRSKYYKDKPARTTKQGTNVSTRKLEEMAQEAGITLTMSKSWYYASSSPEIARTSRQMYHHLYGKIRKRR